MLRITEDPAVADVATGAQSSSILDHLIDVIMRPHRYEVREEAGELFIRPASEQQETAIVERGRCVSQRDAA
jgi:hypothetical protein